MCLCESKVWVCSSATFYGKVSFPPLCPQRLPDTDRACRLCVCGEQTLLVSESSTGRDRVHIVFGASMVKPGSSSKPVSVRLPFWAALFFHPVVVEC